MYDFYGTEEEFEKTNQFLALDEIEHLMEIRLHVDYEPEDKELLYDEQKALYYTDRLFAYSAELLLNHMLVEKCMQKWDQIDWQRTTHNYDYETIAFIRQTFDHPLKWDTPEHINDIICLGPVVTEGYREIQPYGIEDFWDKLYNDGLLWFADNMPAIKDASGGFRYHQTPDDFIAWDRLFSTDAAFYHRYDRKRRELMSYKLFNIQTFRDNISFIAQQRGGAKAAQIVRLLREDWQDILLFKYFDMDEIPQEKVEEFRQCLFEGMDRNLRKWETETPQQADSKLKAERFEYITDLCRKEGKTESVEAELRAASKGTAVAMWKIIRTNEALGYLSTKDVSASKIYKALKAYFGELPYNERNFRDARNKR